MSLLCEIRAKLGKLRRRDTRVLGRRIAPIPCPEYDQREHRQLGPEQRVLPAEPVHEIGNQRWRQCRRDLQPHGLQSLQERPSLRAKPCLHDTGADRKNRPLRKPEDQLQQQEYPKEGAAAQHHRRKRRQQGRKQSDACNDDEHAPRANALADDAARQLEHRVPKNKGPLKPAELHLRDAQIRHHPLGGNGQAFLLQISDAAKGKEKTEYPPADSLPQRHLQRRAAHDHVLVRARSMFNLSRSVTYRRMSRL